MTMTIFKKLSSQFGEWLKPGFQEESTNRATTVEWLIVDVPVPQIQESVQQRSVEQIE